MSLEVLNVAFVLLGRPAAVERAEIPPLAGLRILLPRIQPIFSGRQLPDHALDLEELLGARLTASVDIHRRGRGMAIAAARGGSPPPIS